MKDTSNKTFISKEELLRKWKHYSNLIEKDQTEKVIEQENKEIEEIEKLLPFKNEQEHKKWLVVGMGCKYWEDFEELTMSIINNAPSLRNNSELLESYHQVALDVCRDANFHDLFRVFASLSNGWVKPMEEWHKFYQKMCEDSWNVSVFLENYQDLYGKPYNEKELYQEKNYGFEDCPCAMFYKNNNEGKIDLIECIFERYVQGVEDDELLWFYQRLIKELI